MNKNLNSVYFTNEKKGWTIGVEGTILHTDDGGKNWEQQISGTTNSLNTLRTK